MRPTSSAGLLTPRDLAVLVSCYEYRQLTRIQLERLHFAGLATRPGHWTSSVPLTRLRRLTRAEFLTCRPVPVERPAGRPPLTWSIGKRAIDVLAHRQSLPAEQVRRRQRDDQRLSWYWFPHRQAIADCRIALALACAARGCRLEWLADEQIASLKQTVTVAGARYPIRPDGFFTITLPTGQKASFFLELELQSQGYQEKCRAYLAYCGSQACQQAFAKRVQVLGVTDTVERARRLNAAAEGVSGEGLFWSTTSQQLTANPFGAIWVVSGYDRPAALVPATMAA